VLRRDETDSKVLSYVSVPWGFSTSSYFIDGPEGLVMIDLQFLPSAAEQAIAMVEAQTHKRVVAGIFLHPNPDKFNGASVLKAHGARVLTSTAVAEHVPHVHEIRLAAFYDRYKPDYPKAPPVFETFELKGSTPLPMKLAGVELALHGLGPGCSEAHVVVEWNHHVFVGDLVANGTHSWLEIGRTDVWVDRISEIQKLQPSRVHPGRGPSGGPELLTQQKTYLTDVMVLVGEERPGREDDEEGIERAKKRVLSKYPALDYGVFLDIGLPAEWNRQAKFRSLRGK
jgi:glyoxylase-like metal-dependent hydrolase (beta-lactamase superfamily II)